MQSLARLLAAGPALPTDAWSLGDAELARVIAELGDEPRVVVECGSGRSTVLLARRLRELGGGSVHSLEHDPAWAQLTRMRLAAEDLTAIATVIEAPLGYHPLAPEGCRWYASWALGELPGEIDLLLVDGPPAGEPAIERGRYPALPALAERLAPGADASPWTTAHRAGERWVLDRWRAEGLAHRAWTWTRSRTGDRCMFTAVFRADSGMNNSRKGRWSG